MAREFVRIKVRTISQASAMIKKLAAAERERDIKRVEEIYVKALAQLNSDHLRATTKLVKQCKGDKNSQLKQIMIDLRAVGTDKNDLLCLSTYMKEDMEYADAHPGQIGQIHKCSVDWLTLLENRYFQVFNECVELY